jgi:hypothetical protein
MFIRNPISISICNIPPYPSPSVTSICSHILTKFNQLKWMISLGFFFRYGDSFQAEAVAACVSAETP